MAVLRHGSDYKRGGHVFNDYVRGWNDSIDQVWPDIEQLRAAGIRLAALLDETLGSAPGTVSAEDVDEALTRWDELVDATDA